MHTHVLGYTLSISLHDYLVYGTYFATYTTVLVPLLTYVPLRHTYNKQADGYYNIVADTQFDDMIVTHL